MTKQQYYLTKLAEECAEVAQIALKTQQFGMYEAMRDQPFTNQERCHQELNDLLAVVQVLNENHGFGFKPDDDAIAAKKGKILKYLAYSVELGEVDP